jgi:hypothetical protein
MKVENLKHLLDCRQLWWYLAFLIFGFRQKKIPQKIENLQLNIIFQKYLSHFGKNSREKWNHCLSDHRYILNSIMWDKEYEDKIYKSQVFFPISQIYRCHKLCNCIVPNFKCPNIITSWYISDLIHIQTCASCFKTFSSYHC